MAASPGLPLDRPHCESHAGVEQQVRDEALLDFLDGNADFAATRRSAGAARARLATAAAVILQNPALPK